MILLFAQRHTSHERDRYRRTLDQRVEQSGENHEPVRIGSTRTQSDELTTDWIAFMFWRAGKDGWRRGKKVSA